MGFFGSLQCQDNPQNPEKRKRHAADRDGSDHGLRKPASENTVDQKSGERQQRDQPEVEIEILIHAQFFMVSISSMLNVARFLNTVTMMARPTAASAAATTITKNAKMWPDRK